MTGSNPDDELAIDVDELTLRYGDGTEAVSGLSLSVPRGEFFGFLGPNGAGKTTTVEVLATLLSPTGGEVSVLGSDVETDRTAIRRRIGYMAQETSVDEELTARENLAFACEAYAVPRDRREERIDDLLELVDLADVADTPAGRFSGGMKKRLDAATALVHDPELVFLDEPTTGLDPEARNRLWDRFEALSDAGTTVFLTTQYLGEADRLCDRLAVVRDGSVVARGSPADLKQSVAGGRLAVTVSGAGADGNGTDDQRTANLDRAVRILRDDPAIAEECEAIQREDDRVLLSAPDPADLATDAVVALADAGIGVREVATEEATLDDVFLAIADGETDRFAASADDAAIGGDATGDERDSGSPGGDGGSVADETEVNVP